MRQNDSYLSICVRICQCPVGVSICQYMHACFGKCQIEPINVSIHCYIPLCVIICQYVTVWYSLCQFAPETSSYICIIYLYVIMGVKICHNTQFNVRMHQGSEYAITHNLTSVNVRICHQTSTEGKLRRNEHIWQKLCQFVKTAKMS